MKHTTTKPPPTADSELQEARRLHRNLLVAAGQKSQDDFDKAVLSLSGGALAVSLVFLKDVIGSGAPSRPWLLGAAWTSWAISILAVLVSFFLSGCALRMACAQFDKDPEHTERAGKGFSVATMVCNALGGTFFLAGVAFMVIFALINFEKGVPSNVGQKATVTTATSTAAAGEKARGRVHPATSAAATSVPAVRP